MNTPGFSVYRMGQFAEDLLKPGLQGSILAAISNAIYLRSSSGELLWLVAENIPMHRRGIQIHGALPELAKDSPFSVSGQGLFFSSEFNLDLSAASVWVSTSPNHSKYLPFEDLPDRLRAASCIFDDFPAATGFGPVLLELANNGFDNPFLPEFPDYGSTLKHARPMLDGVFRAAFANDFPRILRVSEDLIGLGEGLTPSGDDFIGGLLFSSSVLRETYAQYQGFTKVEVERFLDSSRNRTNLISYVILKDLASGHAFETLHRFIMAILTDQHLGKARSLGLEVVRIGHSTGWDLLTGVWMGLLLGICSKGIPSSDTPAVASCSH